MRQIITFILLLSFSFVNGQDKIEGIGKFKLNKLTYLQLDSLAQEWQYGRDATRKFSEYSSYAGQKNYLIQLLPDTLKEYGSPPHTHHCKQTRVFYIPTIKVSDIELKDLFLTFYNDTLVELDVEYSSQIVKALSLKYGEPTIEEKEKDIQCTLSLTGSSIALKEKMYYQHWVNNTIRCMAVIGTYYNNDCEKRTLKYINIFATNIYEELRKCDEEAQGKIINKKDQELKKKLDDF
ncbi:MAG: hypothetical protein QM791_04340 [Ferruginibacter sp.]